MSILEATTTTAIGLVALFFLFFLLLISLGIFERIYLRLRNMYDTR